MPLGHYSNHHAPVAVTVTKKQRVTPAVKKYVKSALKRASETKWTAVGNLATDFTTLSASSTTAWTENDRSVTIVEGTDGISQRVGRKILITGFHLKGILQGGQANGALDDNVNNVRIVLTESEVQNPLTGNSDRRLPITKNFNNAGTIDRVLVDKWIVLPVQGRDSTGYLPSIKIVNIHKKLHIPITWPDSGASHPDNHVVLSMISDSSTSPSPGFVSGYYYFTFKDM